MRLILIVLALLAAACGAQAAPSTTNPTTTTAAPPPTSRETTTTEPPAATATPSTTPAPPSTTGHAGPVLVGIAIHAEGFRDEAANADMFRIHSEGLLAVAEAASRHGARLTFDLSPEFLEAHIRWESEFAEQVTAMGHAVGLHADAGGDDPGFAALRQELLAGMDLLDRVAPGATTGSGICSGSPWVEAAVEAGMTATSGVVEYCLRAVDPALLPPAKADVAACRTPADCHGDAFDLIERRLYPIRTSEAATWVVADPGGDLLVLVGESATSVDCLSEGETGGNRCRLDASDISLFTEWIDRYVAARSLPRPATMVMSWSIGSIPDARIADDLFAAVAELTVPGTVEWATVPEIVATTGR